MDAKTRNRVSWYIVQGGVEMKVKHIFTRFHDRIHMRFYGRMILCSMVFFLLVVYVFAFLAATYYSKYQTLTELQQSKNALNSLCNYYDTKQNEFANIICPLYQEDNYENLVDLLSSDPNIVFRRFAWKC